MTWTPRQQAMLREIGIRVWTPPAPEDAAPAAPVPVAPVKGDAEAVRA